MTLGGTIAQKFQVDSLVGVARVVATDMCGSNVRLFVARWHLFNAVAHIPTFAFYCMLLLSLLAHPVPSLPCDPLHRCFSTAFQQPASIWISLF